MTRSEREVLLKFAPSRSDGGVSTGDLQGLLLQVVFALMMIFMIAYFIFVSTAKKERAEQVMDLNRQKLVLALEKTAENRRIRYGLNALMTQGVDGQRSFDAGEYVKGGALDFPPAAKAAFVAGSAAAFADYRDWEALVGQWRREVFAAAELEAGSLSSAEIAWLEGEILARVEAVRLDARGVQRALAAKLQEALIRDPGQFAGIDSPLSLAAAIKARSLAIVGETLGTEVLP